MGSDWWVTDNLGRTWVGHGLAVLWSPLCSITIVIGFHLVKKNPGLTQAVRERLRGPQPRGCY